MPSTNWRVVSCTSGDYLLAHEFSKWDQANNRKRQKIPRNVTDVRVTGVNRTKNNIRTSTYHFEVVHDTG